jgi:hypothetical protein
VFKYLGFGARLSAFGPWPLLACHLTFLTLSFLICHVGDFNGCKFKKIIQEKNLVQFFRRVLKRYYLLITKGFLIKPKSLKTGICSLLSWLRSIKYLTQRVIQQFFSFLFLNNLQYFGKHLKACCIWRQILNFNFLFNY